MKSYKYVTLGILCLLDIQEQIDYGKIRTDLEDICKTLLLVVIFLGVCSAGLKNLKNEHPTSCKS